MSAALYITHARTVEELRSEFLSSIHQKLHALDTEAKYETRVGRAKEIARAKVELQNLLSYWTEVSFAHTKPQSAKAAK